MNVTTTSHAVTVDIPASTNCSSGVFCNKITKPFTAIKSYVSSRAYEITHPTRKNIRSGMNNLAIGVCFSLTIAGIYALIVSEGKPENLTDEQRKIFAIIIFGICLPSSTLIADIVFYKITRS